MKMIIMAGGSGSRLWPLSRTHYPKQFLKLKGMEKSIFQMTIDRCLLIGKLRDIYIVSNRDYLHLIRSQIEEMGLQYYQDRVLLEPEPKNTLPAILFAVQSIRQEGDDVCAVFASDHIIEKPHILAETVLGTQKLARKGFVTFGIIPTGPETGYGYIKPGVPVSGGMKVDEFKEKPDYEHAKHYCASGYLWNSGIFMFETKMFIEAVKMLNTPVYQAFQQKTVREAYKTTPSVSVDYGLIEKLKSVFCVPLDAGWNDLGNFTTFYDQYHSAQDEDGNVHFNREIMHDCKNNMVYSEGDKAIAMVGMTNTVVIDQRDALLICHRDSTQRIKDVVAKLKEKNDPRADKQVTEYRSWGYFTLLESTNLFHVRKLVITPQKSMHYQVSPYENENWVVVEGTAEIKDGVEKVKLCHGESFCAQSGNEYQLVNAEKGPLVLIEVQIGPFVHNGFDFDNKPEE